MTLASFKLRVEEPGAARDAGHGVVRNSANTAILVPPSVSYCNIMIMARRAHASFVVATIFINQ